MVSELAQVRDMIQSRRRLVFVGDEQAGKSAFINVLRNLPCPTDSYTLDDYPNVTIVDTAGASAFDRLRPFSYEGATDVVVCFSVDSLMSFEQVQEKWVPEVRYFCAGCPLSLLATKCDLRHDKSVVERLKNLGLAPITTEQGQQLAKAIGATDYFECSAKTGTDIRTTFEAILSHAPERTERISLTPHARDADADSIHSTVSDMSSDDETEVGEHAPMPTSSKKGQHREKVDSGADFSMDQVLAAGAELGSRSDSENTITSSPPTPTTPGPSSLASTPARFQPPQRSQTISTSIASASTTVAARHVRPGVERAGSSSRIERGSTGLGDFGDVFSSSSSLAGGSKTASPSTSLADSFGDSLNFGSSLGFTSLNAIAEDEEDETSGSSMSPQRARAAAGAASTVRRYQTPLPSATSGGGSTADARKRTSGLAKLDLDFDLGGDMFSSAAGPSLPPKSAILPPSKDSLMPGMDVPAMPSSAMTLERRASLAHVNPGNGAGQAGTAGQGGGRGNKSGGGWGRLFGKKKNTQYAPTAYHQQQYAQAPQQPYAQAPTAARPAPASQAAAPSSGGGRKASIWSILTGKK
ncbi:Rho GTPase [Polyrhizophydium stewartii]|uniref:Rho GTPase n=1 Tax=Polyrhizophydium stewartii TaxID=2732419 RepID=A0ABR4N0M5_9FUNG